MAALRRRHMQPPPRLQVDAAGTDVESLILQLADSALPVGTFTQSFGLESALHEGQVSNEPQVAAWLSDYLLTSVATTDLLSMRLLCEGGDVGELDEILTACLIPEQIRSASRTMALRLMDIARECFPSPALRSYADAVATGSAYGHYCLAYALTLHGWDVALARIQRSYATSVVVGLAQNAVRAVPLGQTAGQRIIAALHPVIGEAIARAQQAPVSWLGAVAPQLEVAQMRHEHQHARMFMS